MHNSERFVYKRSPFIGECSQKKADKSRQIPFLAHTKKHLHAGNLTTVTITITGTVDVVLLLGIACVMSKVKTGWCAYVLNMLPNFIP